MVVYQVLPAAGDAAADKNVAQIPVGTHVAEFSLSVPASLQLLTRHSRPSSGAEMTDEWYASLPKRGWR